MIRLQNHLGTVEISENYFANLVGRAASSCFGVAGMVRSGARQGIRSLITRRSHEDDGVRVRSEDGKLVVDLHIEVTQGINISAIVKSIVNNVRYVVEEATGLEVKKVNVFIDSIRTE